MDKAKRFEALVEAFSSELYRYAYWLCDGDRSQAEDLVQETYTRAWRVIETLRDEQSARGWLYTILRREHARLFERFRPELENIDDIEIPAPTMMDTSTEALMLRHVLKTLPDSYREPLVLQVLGGFSAEEIGAIMGISANTVMTRVFRARKKLRDMLNAEPVPVHRGEAR